MKAYLEIPTVEISSKTVFSKDGTITTTSSNPPLDILKKNGGIVICGQSMKKVEEIQTVKSYEMPPDFITFIRHHIAQNENQRVM